MNRGWAKLLLDRRRGLVEDPRQPRTHARETDEGDAEAHAYFNCGTWKYISELNSLFICPFALVRDGRKLPPL